MSVLNTIIPEEEVVTRKQQVKAYLGMALQTLITALVCTLVTYIVVDWRNTVERRELVASYSHQIQRLTDELQATQTRHGELLADQAVIMSDMRGMLEQMTSASTKIKTSAKLVDDAASKIRLPKPKPSTPKAGPPAMSLPPEKSQAPPRAPSLYQN